MDISALVVLEGPLEHHPGRTHLLRVCLLHRLLQLLHLAFVLVAVLFLNCGDLGRADVEGEDGADEVVVGDAVEEGHVVHQHQVFLHRVRHEFFLF